jgi:hypothetical protein
MNNGEYFYWHKKPLNLNSGNVAVGTLSSAQNIGTINNNATQYQASNVLNAQIFYIPNPIPPPAPPVYPNPVASPQNQLDNNRKYRFKVTATLEELNSDNVWVTAKTRTNQLVVETETRTYITPSILTNNTQVH